MVERAQNAYARQLIKGKVPPMNVPRTEQEATEFMNYLSDKKAQESKELLVKFSQQLEALQAVRAQTQDPEAQSHLDQAINRNMDLVAKYQQRTSEPTT